MTKRSRKQPKAGALVPRNEALGMLAQNLNRILNGDMNPPIQGFVLLVFPFNMESGTHIDFVSNADVETIVSGLRDLAGQIEEKLDAPSIVQH